MQTFLPYPSFERTARVLDVRRLGKQRVEALQVLRAQHVPNYGWRHHPAVKMWRGHDEALVSYGVTICREWIRRGHRDTVLEQLVGLAPDGEVLPQAELRQRGLFPPWLGNRAFHRAHQSSLVRKDPELYRAAFPNVPDDLPYVWPEP
jgi:pyrimidine dimer DNA glycosylase